ncbi:MAG: hypothetical protein E7Z92_04115 [Cyanobacteria bacterium SIG31]|nr:hypothetical protein [Cyanobacteria bacterium SIG31]
MIKLNAENMAIVAEKIKNPITKSVTILKEGRPLGGCEFGNNPTTQSMREHYVTKLENLTKNLPENCGELFVKIV